MKRRSRRSISNTVMCLPPRRVRSRRTRATPASDARGVPIHVAIRQLVEVVAGLIGGPRHDSGPRPTRRGEDPLAMT